MLDATTKFLDTAQVGELLGLKAETVRWYHKRGILPPADHRFGRTPVWMRSTIDAWITQRNEVTEVEISDTNS